MNLENKIIDFLGDSITEGAGVEDCIEKKYDNIIKEKCKLKEKYTHAVSGSRFAHQEKPSEKPRYDLCFCGRAYYVNENSDIVVVYGGVNDYIHGDAPFGKMSDKTPETYCGAVDFLMNLLCELYPKAQKVFLTPARCCYKDIEYEKKSYRSMKKEDAKPLKYYCDVIVEKGKEYNIPVLNLYENLPIDPKIEEQKEKYMVDGLHFNKYGHEVLADLVIEFLEKL